MHDRVQAAATQQLERTTEALDSWMEQSRSGDQAALDVSWQLQHEIAYWQSIVDGTRTPALWLSEGGELACELHIGHYAQAALHSRPTSRHLLTPLDSWHRMEPYDLEELRQLGATAACESCTTTPQEPPA